MNARDDGHDDGVMEMSDHAEEGARNGARKKERPASIDGGDPITTVPFSEIDIDPDFNVRTQYDSKEIQDLADSIKEVGLKTPLTITDGGTKKGKPYRLTSGFRRSLALGLLKWGSKPVKVVFERYQDEGKRFLSNLAENTAREDVHPHDQAKRYYELETGITYDGVVTKLIRKDIAKATSLSQAHIGNLVRSWRNLSEDSKRAWRKHDLPLSIIFQLARTEDGAPLTEEVQEEELAEYLAQEEAKAEGGTKRRKKKDEEGEEGNGKATTKELRDRREFFAGVLDEGGLKGMERAFVEGKLQGLRFALGEIKARGLVAKYEG